MITRYQVTQFPKYKYIELIQSFKDISSQVIYNSENLNQLYAEMNTQSLTQLLMIMYPGEVFCDCLYKFCGFAYKLISESGSKIAPEHVENFVSLLRHI